MWIALFITLVAIAGIGAGIFLGDIRKISPRIIASGGGLLFGLSLFWMFPEMIEQSGWSLSAGLLVIGIGILWIIDHHVYSICPACSHTHHHENCGTPLHGFAGPLLIASALHSLLDGASVRLFDQQEVTAIAIFAGLALHKIPEGLALGLIARKSMSSPWNAFFWCCAAESMTLVGAFFEPKAHSEGLLRFGIIWPTIILALVASSFLYLGFHSVHNEYKTRGVLPSFLATFAAIGGIAMLHSQLPGH